MTDPIEAAIRKAVEATLVGVSADWLDSEPVLEAVMRSLASTVRDAVLEEAAKEANVCASGCLECATEAAFAARIRALKSQPADKGKENA